MTGFTVSWKYHQTTRKKNLFISSKILLHIISHFQEIKLIISFIFFCCRYVILSNSRYIAGLFQTSKKKENKIPQGYQIIVYSIQVSDLILLCISSISWHSLLFVVDTLHILVRGEEILSKFAERDVLAQNWRSYSTLSFLALNYHSFKVAYSHASLSKIISEYPRERPNVNMNKQYLKCHLSFFEKARDSKE